MQTKNIILKFHVYNLIQKIIYPSKNNDDCFWLSNAAFSTLYIFFIFLLYIFLFLCFFFFSNLLVLYFCIFQLFDFSIFAFWISRFLYFPFSVSLFCKIPTGSFIEDPRSYVNDPGSFAKKLIFNLLAHCRTNNNYLWHCY